MKKIFLIIIMVVNIYGWEINTHRAIDRKAIENSANLKSFIQSSNIKNENYIKEKFEGYGSNMTYINYVLNGEENGVSANKWNQYFSKTSADYQDLLEAGTILEDAQWPHSASTPNKIDKADGRFVNHFYDAQFSGSGSKGLVYGGIRFLSADLWALQGIDTVNRHNLYSYNNALDYFKKGFTESNPTERKKYQAKMLVSVGHLMHMVNDMSSTAHTRADPHAEGDVMEVWGSGGENGNKSTGFRVSGNTLKSYAGISKNPDNRVPKYGKFSEFITGEARWTATHFFSKDTIFTKRLPKKSDTYEELFYNGNGLEKYYIRSDSISGIPRRTKLAIRVKSYIINTLKERYYRDDSVGMGFDMSTSFRGNYSVVEENARILIPRAIANARNFLNYFFRGQISATITNNEITVTNVSNPSLVAAAKYTTTFINIPATVYNYRFMYENNDGTRHPFLFKYDPPSREIAYIGSMEHPPTVDGFTTVHSLASGHTIKVPIKLDYDGRQQLATKKIILVYDANIGSERGISTCYVSKIFTGTGQRE